MNDFQDSNKMDTILDEINFRNMVSYYYNELVSIKNGVRADEVFIFKERKMLKIGVLFHMKKDQQKYG